MGLNTAFQIARRSPNLKIAVFEKDRGVGGGSTGQSSGILRRFYSLDPMVRFAVNGYQIYQNWPDYLKINNPRFKQNKLFQISIFNKAHVLLVFFLSVLGG